MYFSSAHFRHSNNCIFVSIVALQATKKLLPTSLQRKHNQRVSQPSPPSRVWEGSALLDAHVITEQKGGIDLPRRSPHNLLLQGGLYALLPADHLCRSIGALVLGMRRRARQRRLGRAPRQRSGPSRTPDALVVSRRHQLRARSRSANAEATQAEAGGKGGRQMLKEEPFDDQRVN